MRLLPNHGRRSRGLIFGPLAHRRFDSGRKPQAYIFDQGRKLASPQACVKKSQKAASYQARAQDHTRPQGRKPASTPRRAGKALKSNARPLVEGGGSDSTPQIPTFWNIFVDTYNFVLTVNAKALISNAHSKQKENAYATQQETIPTQRP